MGRGRVRVRVRVRLRIRVRVGITVRVRFYARIKETFIISISSFSNIKRLYSWRLR